MPKPKKTRFLMVGTALAQGYRVEDRSGVRVADEAYCEDCGAYQ